MDPPLPPSDERGLLVLCEHAISHPDETWPQVRDACIRIGVELHVDRLMLPLWSVQELALAAELHSKYLLVFKIQALDRIHHHWQTNWLEALLEAAVTYRTQLRWYGRAMNRALTYERWLVQDCVGVVVISRPDTGLGAAVCASALAVGLPIFRIDPDSCKVFRIKSTTKERTLP